MDLLTEFLIQDLLENPKIVAIYGGGFKPPTKGHFAVAKKVLDDFPEIDELKIAVGSGIRDGVTQDESIKIWNIYKSLLSNKVTIEPAVAPVKFILDYAKNNPQIKVYWILGAREDNEDDIKDIESRTRSLSKYPNIEVKIITTIGGISGTKTRQAIRDNNKEQFFHMIPDVSNEEKEKIWSMISPVIKENLNEIGDASASKYKWEEVDVEGYYVYTRFITDSETQYDVDLETRTYVDNDNKELRALGVEFSAKPKGAERGSAKIVVNKGELYKVMSTITDIIKYYLSNSRLKIQAILYSPSKKSDEGDFGAQRDNLYKAFISKSIPGVKFEQKGEIVAAILPGVNEGSCGYDTDVKTGKKLNTPGGLEEGKQVGIIYHYTTFEAGFKILQSNQLKSGEAADSTKSNPIYAISFTRDKRFHNNHNVGFDVSSFGQRPQVRFTVDGDKLSNKFKVQPYSQGGVFSKDRKGFEAEERVISNKPFSIPIIPYIKSIDILIEYKKPGKDDWDMEYDYETYAPLSADLIKFTQDKNIPINLIVNKNGDPWPDKAKKTIIQKILNWVGIKENLDPKTFTNKNSAIPYGSGFAPVKELENDRIECNNCDNSWPIADGGDDLYICHKCGHDNTLEQLNEKCWAGYERKGTKTMFGKKYPNCVKK